MFATAIIHTFVSNDEKFEQRKVLGETRQIAYRDALTGVKSIHAYVEARARIDRQMDINKQKGVVTVSSGLDIYVKGGDNDFNTIFERADKKMYERKKMMKASV